MTEDIYSDIRPYNDDEIPAALERIVNDPFFVPAVNFAFPDADMERIAEVVRTCKTVDQMQQRIMISIIKRIIDTSIDNFTWSGMENVERARVTSTSRITATSRSIRSCYNIRSSQTASLLRLQHWVTIFCARNSSSIYAA